MKAFQDDRKLYVRTASGWVIVDDFGNVSRHKWGTPPGADTAVELVEKPADPPDLVDRHGAVWSYWEGYARNTATLTRDELEDAYGPVKEWTP